MAHDEALKYGGGVPGVLNQANLEGALGRPFHGYHRSIAQKAVALLHGLATCHGFADANKRTAWMVTELMILLSGYEVDMPDDWPTDVLVRGVVERVWTEAEVAAWFRARLNRIE